MAYDSILVDTDGAVAVITLNRPERRNAWTPDMSQELQHAIQAINDDPALGAIVVTGAGKSFCAGADIEHAFKARLTDIDEGSHDSNNGMPAGVDWIKLCGESKPLIAAVNGHSVGIGATMILPFDVIVASTAAQFGMFFVKMGLVPELASSHFLERRVGFGNANKMCLTARLFGAEECEKLGLVDQLSTPERLVDDAKALAAEIAGNPDRQLRMIKGLLRENGVPNDYKAIQAKEGALLEQCYPSAEHREAVDAFLNKRKPDFRKAAAE